MLVRISRSPSSCIQIACLIQSTGEWRYSMEFSIIISKGNRQIKAVLISILTDKNIKQQLF